MNFKFQLGDHAQIRGTSTTHTITARRSMETASSIHLSYYLDDLSGFEIAEQYLIRVSGLPDSTAPASQTPNPLEP